MILPASFQSEWIQQISKSIGKRGDPKLIEKIIYAFALLEQLKLSGLDLIFKGGTSVFLMTDPPSRFSIDVDIIVSDKPEKMQVIFDKVIKIGYFLSWKEDKDRKMAVNAPVGHYKFFYQSIDSSHFGNEPILLDVLQDAFNTALLITKRDHTSDNFIFLQKGISNIVNFIIATFRIEDAIICASKVAYLSQVIKQSNIYEVARYTTPEIVANLFITQPEYARFNRLKNTSPEAFFYWFHALNSPSIN